MSIPSPIAARARPSSTASAHPGTWTRRCCARRWRSARAAGKLPKAVVVVDLYGQAADLDAIKGACDEYDVPLVEDAAAAVGTTYKGRAAGTVGKFGAFSFNGNKIITTSGGGMLVSDDGAAIEHARKLATQARDPAVHYLHTEIGYNYRLSNVLAAIGRGQLPVVEDRVATRRRNYDSYVRALGDLPGITFQPEAPWGRHTRWLINILIDPARFGADREAVRAGAGGGEHRGPPLVEADAHAAGLRGLPICRRGRGGRTVSKPACRSPPARR